MKFPDSVFATILNPDKQAAAQARLQSHKEYVAEFALLANEALAEKAQYYLDNCEQCRFPKGEPVYDAVMQHVIIPELIARLRD